MLYQRQWRARGKRRPVGGGRKGRMIRPGEGSGFKQSQRSEAGGVHGEEKLGGQEAEEGSRRRRRRRRIGVRGGPVEMERQEGGKGDHNTVKSYHATIDYQ